MPKNKRQKHARLTHLPNVTHSNAGDLRPSEDYPWNKACVEGMPTVLELGCGKGEHSLAFAAANPQRRYVGVDRKSHRLCVGAERAIAEKLDNVHFLRSRIENIPAFFTEQSIREIWLTFPDPHPKNRTRKHRLSAAPFLEMYARLLTPDGTVHLKTDSALLFSFTQDTVERWGGRVLAAWDDIHALEPPVIGAATVVSAYDRLAQSRGLAVKYMVFQLSR
jgi:tRNA (guanine-N7-)-methyltransferase